MSEQGNRYQGNPSSSIRLISDFVMGIIYVGLGIVVLIRKRFFNFEVTGPIAYALVGLFILYGTFRVYRAFIAFKARKQG